MKYRAILSAAVVAAIGGNAFGAVWNNAAGGAWDVATNWTPNAVPNDNTKDGDIQLDGTYTVTNGSNSTFRDLTLGTTSTSGKQTYRQTNFLGISYRNATIGANGIFFQEFNAGGTGLITIQSGGEYRSSDNAVRGTGTGKLIDLQAGGTLTTSTGGGFKFEVGTHTINGTVTGAGGLESVNVNHTGTGTIGGAGTFTLFGVNTFSGGLTVSRPITSTTATLLANGSTLTLNGSYTQLGGSRSVGAATSGGSVTIIGSGNLSFTADGTSGPSLRFGGATSNNDSFGTLTIGGAGTLLLASTSNYLNITAGTLNLQRDTTFSGDVRGTNGGLVNFSGTGKTLTIGSGGAFRSDTNVGENKSLNVNGDGTLLLTGGTILTRNGANDAVNIGETTAGTISLGASSTSGFNKNTLGGAGGDPTLHLHANAITSSGAGGVLSFNTSKLRVDGTNAANWGWDTAGELRVASNGVTLEALSDDLGDTVSPASVGFSLNRLSFADPGATVLLTLAENTSNDGGVADRALYVGTLDLSSLNAGRVVNLTGFSGAERVYYSALINPNGAVIDSTKYIQVVPEPTVLAAATLFGLLASRRRTKNA